MTLWLMLIVTIAMAAVFVSALPLCRLNARAVAVSQDDLSIYLDRLVELEREAAVGALDATAAESGRMELRKQILSADCTKRRNLERLALNRWNLAIISAAGVAILTAVGVWSTTSITAGSLVKSVQPNGGRNASVVDQLAAAAAALPAGPIVPNRPSAGLPSVDEMIDRLVQKLKKTPNDAEGWRMLGWSYFNTDHFAEAAAAYAKAVALVPGNADLKSAYGEALVRASNGRVGGEAKSVFEQVLQSNSADARARYFIGVEKAQAGDEKAALDDWIRILNDTDSNEPWFTELKQRTNELSQKLGIDLSDKVHRRETAVKTDVSGLSKTQSANGDRSHKNEPTAEDVQRAEAMPAADRETMIRGMVDGLAAHLAQSPNDAEGWIKLIRSRQVLGETEAAKQALHHALEIFRDAPEEHDKIVATGREIGLSEQ